MHDAARLFAQTNHLRGPLAPRPDLPAWKEWWHVCIHHAAFTWIGNFSMGEDAFASDRRLIGRVIGMGRSLPDGAWHGELAQFLPGEFRAPFGQIDAALGEHSLLWRDDALHLRMRQPGLAADLTLRPVARPALSHQIALGPHATIHWLMAPRMLASGTLTIGGTTHALHDVPSYHDHNWGRFAWGDDFSWEWGYALPNDAANPWTIVSVRLHDRNRASLHSAGLFLWRKDAHHKVFRDAQVVGRTSGRLATTGAFALPSALALVTPAALDVPERLELRAQDGGDVLDVQFTAQDVARILLPNDAQPMGVTAICEVSGEVRAEGRVRGEPVALNGRAVYEFTRHG
jgi:hypothetical protein